MTATLERIASTLDDHFAAVAERDHVPGIAFGFVRGGSLAHAGGVGTTSVDTNLAPDLDTPARICSMTKSFTAAALLMLRDEGTLALDEPVAAYVAPLRALDPPTADSPPVTVRHLMSMASGLPEDNAWADRHLHASRREMRAILSAGATFARAPGLAYEYSNLGWGILGNVVEALTGERAQAFVTSRVLEPLGLSNTTWDRPEGGQMTGYRRRDDRWVPEPAPLPDGAFVAGGGLWSTVRDVATWVAYLLDAFPPRDEAQAGPMARASRREMQQVQRAAPSTYDRETGRLTAGGYGFGLVVEHDLRFGTIVRHGGGLPGFASQMMWLPDRGVGIVVLTNLTGVKTEIVSLEALERLDDVEALPAPALEPTPALRAACDGVVALLTAWDDALADDLFADNVDQDESRERRRDRAEALRRDHGPFALDRIDAESSTTATIHLKGAGGATTTVEVTLTPQVPPRLQGYEVTPPPSDATA